MPNTLENIIAHKKKKLATEKTTHRFYHALASKELSIIAEIKRRSPSVAHIAPIAHPEQLARTYTQAGADALSILTDEEFFGGQPNDLRLARTQTQLPILRKDFIISHQQIIESVKLGADAILLILSVLNPQTAKTLFKFAKDCGLDILVETHNKEQIDRAIKLGANIIGINNRDLTSFKTDIHTSITLCQHIPADIIRVSESGIYTEQQAQALAQAGFDALLIGQALIQTQNKKSMITAFKQRAQP